MALLQQLSQQEAHLEARGPDCEPILLTFQGSPARREATWAVHFSPSRNFGKATRDVDLGGVIEEILSQ